MPGSNMSDIEYEGAEKRPLQPCINASNDLINDQDIILLVDGSSSISRNDFEKMKQICLSLSARFTPTSTQLGLVQFSGIPKEEQFLTSDRTLFETKVKGMQQLSQSTNVLSGLKLCDQLFSQTSKPTNHKQVWLLTDGCYDEDPSIFANSLKRKGVLITAIGIGNGGNPEEFQRNLKQVADLGRAHMLNDYEHAIDFVKNRVKLREEDLVSISVSLLDPPYRIGFGAWFDIEVENISGQTIPANSAVYISKNEYFNANRIPIPTAIKSGESWSTKFKLKCQNMDIPNRFQEYIHKLPSKVDVSLMNPQNQVIPTNATGFKLEMQLFAADILTWKPKDRNTKSANILIFGPQGSGKSSFVNALYSALGEEVADHAQAGGTASRVTKGLERFPVNTEYILSDTRICFFDCPGFENNGGCTYEGEEIEMIMEGVLRLGTELVNTTLNYSDVMHDRNSAEEAYQQRVHGVIFVIPQKYASTQSQLEPYTELYEKLTVRLKRKAVVAVSRFDEVAPEHRDSVRIQVASAFNIPIDKVYPLINYSSGLANNTKSFDMDKKIIHILHSALTGCNEFMTREKNGQVPTKYKISGSISNDSFQELSLRGTYEERRSISRNSSRAEMDPYSGLWTFLLNLLNDEVITEEQHESIRSSDVNILKSIYDSAMEGKTKTEKAERFKRSLRVYKLI